MRDREGEGMLRLGEEREETYLKDGSGRLRTEKARQGEDTAGGQCNAGERSLVCLLALAATG